MSDELKHDPAPADEKAQAEPQKEVDLSASRAASRRAVYAMIAEALPLEGRDFLVSVTFADGSSVPSVSLTGLNKFGTEWCRHMADVFRYNNEIRRNSGQ